MSWAVPAPKPKHGRNKRKMSDKGKITPAVYDEAVERCGGVCEMCGKPPEFGTKRDRLEAAHLIRRSQGGRGDQPWMVAMLCGPSVNTGTCHNNVDYTRWGRVWAQEKMEELRRRYKLEDWPE